MRLGHFDFYGIQNVQDVASLIYHNNKNVLKYKDVSVGDFIYDTNHKEFTFTKKEYYLEFKIEKANVSNIQVEL